MERLTTEIEFLKQSIAPLIEKYKQNQIEHEIQKEKQQIALLELKSMTKTIDKNHEKHYNYLMTQLNLNSIDQLSKKLRLLYRGSDHNFDCSTFHQLCDGKGKTLVLVRSKTNTLFGGYATTAWHSNKSYSPAPGSFLFNLDKQTQHKIYRNEGCAIYGHVNFGPLFGNGYDLHLTNNCNLNNDSSSNLGNTYSLPNNISYGTNESQSYLVGSYQFVVEEYEVFLVD